MPIEVYPPDHAGLFIAAFALASALAVLALVFRRWRRAGACAALVLAGAGLACSSAEALRGRAAADARLGADQRLSACDRDLVRREAYGEARADVSLALLHAPFALVVATFVAARALKRSAIGWAIAPWALFATAGYLYLQPLPGRFLSPGRCELYRERDAVLGADPEGLRRACLDLAARLKDPRALVVALGGQSQESVIPELRTMKKRCLTDRLDWARSGGPEYMSRGEILGSPFVTPKDLPEVQKKLDEMGAP